MFKICLIINVIFLKPVGEIGEITSTAGRAEFRVTNNNFKVWDIIGRSCVLHDQAQTTDNR